MQIFGIIAIIVSIILFILSGIFLWIDIALNHMPKQIKKTRARLMDKNHQQDVPIFDYSLLTDQSYITEFIENRIIAKYLYSVKGRTYKIKDHHFGTPKQTPAFLSIVYLKKFPQFARLMAVLYPIIAIVFKPLSTSSFHFVYYV